MNLKTYENSSENQGSKLNVTNLESLLVFTMGYILAKLHQFLIISFRDFVRRDAQTHTQMPSKTIPARSMRARNENESKTFQFETRRFRRYRFIFGNLYLLHHGNSKKIISPTRMQRPPGEAIAAEMKCTIKRHRWRTIRHRSSTLATQHHSKTSPLHCSNS